MRVAIAYTRHSKSVACGRYITIHQETWKIAQHVIMV